LGRWDPTGRPRKTAAAAALVGPLSSCESLAYALTEAWAGLATSLFSGANWLVMKVAPCGSSITVVRAQAMSGGSAPRLTFPEVRFGAVCMAAR
jgi:hypothetical protein